MIIDAHHHLWKHNHADYAWITDEMTMLRHDFLLPELEHATQASAVEGTVVVQARQSIDETAWLLDLADRHPSILGVVGWVPLTDPGVGDHLAHFAQHPKLKAVRHVLHDEPDDRYILRDDFNHGVHQLQHHNLAYDILIYERHLPQTIAFIDRHPHQTFIIDHIAKPRIKDRVLSPWKEHITDLAKRENVYCKLSGMTTEADWDTWTPDTLRPYFDVILAAFGPRRLMFGSDWPVSILAGSYATWVATVHAFIHELSPEEQECIFRSSAIAAYQL